MNSSPLYFAISADLVGSRRVDDRIQLSRQIEIALVKIRTVFAGEWAAPLVSARGMDELSGVLRRPRSAYDVAMTMNEAIWPWRFRWAVASGRIDIGEDQSDATKMDGPAFHRAADALAKARREGLPFAIEFSEIDPRQTRLAVELARMHALLVATWTPARVEAVRAWRQLRHQVRVSEKLEKSQQAVSKALRAAHVSDLEAIEESIRDWLETIHSQEQS